MMVLSMGVAGIVGGTARTITGLVEALAAVADDIERRELRRRATDSPLEEFSVVCWAFNSVLDELKRAS